MRPRSAARPVQRTAVSTACTWRAASTPCLVIAGPRQQRTTCTGPVRTAQADSPPPVRMSACTVPAQPRRVNKLRKQLSDRHPPAKCGPRGFSPTHQSYGQASDALLDPGNARGLAEQVGRHGAVAGEAFVMRLAFEPAVVDLLADDSPL